MGRNHVVEGREHGLIARVDVLAELKPSGFVDPLEAGLQTETRALRVRLQREGHVLRSHVLMCIRMEEEKTPYRGRSAHRCAGKEDP